MTSHPSQIFGNYEILEKIGQGGMGAVYKARQISMDRLVALKILPKKLAQDEAYVARFQREARSAGMVNHPHLIQVYDCGRIGELWFFSMEYVPGCTLRQLLKQQGPLGEIQALGLLRKVAAALGAAHAKGIIHRDVKPENILLDLDGEPKLADLGLAKPMDGMSDVTLTGQALGTPLYMSPEQALGKALDGRSDFYSLGATFYHLLAGVPVFQGPTVTVVSVKHATEPPPPIRTLRAELSPGLEAFLDSLLAKSPDNRPADLQALLAALDAVQAGKIPAQARTPATRVPHRARSMPAAQLHPAQHHPAWLWPAVAAGILVLGGLGFTLFRPATESPPRAVPPRTAANDPVKPPAPVPATAPAPIPAQLQLKLHESLAYAEAHPDDSDGQRSRFQALLAAVPAGSPVAATCRKELKRLDEQLTAATLQLATGRLDAAEQHLLAGRLAEAVSVLDELSRSTTPSLRDRVRQLQQRLGEAIKAHVQAQAEQLNQALTAHDLDRADQVLATLTALAADKLTATAATAILPNLRTKVEAARKAHQQSLEAVGTQAATKAIDALLAGNPAEVRRSTQEGLDDRSCPLVLQQLHRSVLAVLDAFEARQTTVRNALRQKENQPLTVQTAKRRESGVLRKLDDRGLHLALVDDGREVGTMVIAWSEISPAQWQEWARVWKPDSPDDHLVLALQALTAGDEALARTSLAQAGNHPLAGPLTTRLATLSKARIEQVADKAWQDLARRGAGKIDRTTAARLLEELATFGSTYGGTDLATARKAEIEALRQHLTRLAEINLLVNGSFEDGENGWLVGREGRREVRLAFADHPVFDGRRALRVNDEQKHVRFAQLLDLPSGRTMRLSLAARWLRKQNDRKSFAAVVVEIRALRPEAKDLPDRLEPNDLNRFLDQKKLASLRPGLRRNDDQWVCEQDLFVAPATRAVLTVDVSLRNDDGEVLLDALKVVQFVEGTRPP